MLRKKLLKFKIIFYVKFWKIINFFYPGSKSKVIIITEKENWAIKRVSTNIKKNIDKEFLDLVSISSIPEKFQNKIIHFGSHYMWLLKYKYLSKNNKYIVSFFHGNPNESLEEKIVFKNFLKSIKYLEKIIVSNSIVYNRLIKHGVSRKLLIMIPIGVDTNFFKPPNKQQRIKARSYFNFKNDEIVIGSFQKDGKGWGQGMEPKLIKGPDIFYKVIRILNNDFKIKILLTGPARGYLKNKFKKYNISYFHSYLKEYADLKKYYHALDIYLITSREEGGPMGLLESISSGVPVVSTNVGMAPDFINSKKTGIIVNTLEPKEIAKKIKEFLHTTHTSKVKEIYRKVIMKADWEVVSKHHMERVYRKLLKENK